MDFVPTYERRVTASDEGSDWLYIDPKQRAHRRVEIDVVPDKAQKIRIQHLDRDMRGKSEWVPVARAKVPWELREAYLSTMAMWEMASQHHPPTAHSDMAIQMVGTYLDDSVAEIYGNGAAGILEIRDIATLSRITKMPERELTGHPDSFRDESWFVPWPTALEVMRSLCALDPRPAMELLAQRRADERRYAMNVAKSGDPWWTAEANEGDKHAGRARQWHESKTESTRFLRELVDGGHPSLADDFIELREMYLDYVRIMPTAISRIRMIPAQISQSTADELQRLTDRPLPRSAEILGGEPPDPSAM